MNNTLVAMDGSGTFMFDGHAVRAGSDEGKPWVCVLDMLKALDDKPFEGKKYNVTVALKGLDAEELILNSLPDDQGVMQPTACVFESGLWFLIAKSRKPSAKKFQAWLRKEVLPAINRTGTYTLPSRQMIPADSVLPLLEARIREISDAALQTIRGKDAQIQTTRRLFDAAVLNGEQLEAQRNEALAAEEATRQRAREVAEALNRRTEEATGLYQRVAEMEPKEEYFDAMLDDDANPRLLRDALKHTGLLIGERDVRILLEEHGIIYVARHPSGRVEYIPMKAQLLNGRFAVQNRVWEDPETGTRHAHSTLRVTLKGEVWLRAWLLSLGHR